MKGNRLQMLFFRESMIQMDVYSLIYTINQTAHADGFGRWFSHQCFVRDVALLAGLFVDITHILSAL